MEEKVIEYYSKFKEIYTEENYPKWFNFLKDHNKQFGKDGYSSKEHELKHFAILQNPIPLECKIILVGKNNSWFDEGDMKNSLKIVKSLKHGIPSENYLTKKTSRYSKQLHEIFKGPQLNSLFRENTLGMNRIWLQTGPSSKNIEKMKEPRLNAPFEEVISGSSLVDKCHQWTKEIIRIINPKVLILFGNSGDSNCAWKLFNEGDDVEPFVIKHCSHPGNRMADGKNKVRDQIKEAWEAYKNKDIKFKGNI